MCRGSKTVVLLISDLDQDVEHLQQGVILIHSILDALIVNCIGRYQDVGLLNSYCITLEETRRLLGESTTIRKQV